MIEAENLRKVYRVNIKKAGLKGAFENLFHTEWLEKAAVDGLTFRMEEGRALACIGENGAGKSTLIKMMIGILTPTEGEVRVFGQNPRQGGRKYLREIGVVFGQKSNLWTDIPVIESYRAVKTLYRLEESTFRRNFDRVVELLALEELLSIPARKLSLGQRMRADIGMVFLHEPKLLFLDEPTIGLDPVVKENIRGLIKQMNREFHTTVFLTSHDVGDIEKLCKRIIIVNTGQIVLDDSMEHLKYHYLNKKIVEVKMQEEMKLPAVEGITILKEKGGHIKMEVDTAVIRINDALQRINAEHVEDINISNVPLENIIMEIYKADEAV